MIVIYVAVMAAVIRGPVQGRVLQGEGATDGEQPLQRRVRLVGLVGPESVIARGD